MDPRACLTLLTDFGTADVYVGVVKGAIAQVNPHLTVIDLTHQIPPQNIAAARFALMTAFPYFPTGTVHMAVVDPGVGTQRRAIALAVGRDATNPHGFLVGPDNGLFSGVLSREPLIAAIELSHPQYWRTPEPSPTFHGRDIFAAVAAHLASGVPLTQLGRTIAPETLVQMALPPLKTEILADSSRKITGMIQAIDHFGNLVTTIPAELVRGKNWSAVINRRVVPGKHTYCDRPNNDLVALVGSHGWVEVAVNGGNAQATLKLNWGEGIEVIVESNTVEGKTVEGKTVEGNAVEGNAVEGKTP